jgi:hypothetical protein
MKQSRKEQIEQLERALARARAAQEAPRFSNRWLESVMREIRRQPTGLTPFLEVPRLVWRAAAIVVLVSLIFVGSVLAWNAGGTDADFSALLSVATVEPTFLAGEL